MFQVLTYFQVKKSFGGPATCDEASTPEGKDHVSGSYLLPGQEELRRPGHVRRGIEARGQGLDARHLLRCGLFPPLVGGSEDWSCSLQELQAPRRLVGQLQQRSLSAR